MQYSTRPSVLTRTDTGDAPSSSGRNLVLMFDGTSNSYGNKLTNLPVLSSFLSRDSTSQLIYYQTGIGTYEPMYTPFGLVRIFSRMLDKAIAWDLPQHVQDGYRYLMEHYRPGDNIFLFGFSRGAFTCRALAGMLQCVGLLYPGNEQSVSLAYHIYSQGYKPLNGDQSMASGFKRTFARTVDVHFVGVWDTVASVGALIPRTLPFASGSSHIHHFAQALALDERRSRFQPSLWQGSEKRDSCNQDCGPGSDGVRHSVKEVWFSGVHSDVGGGQTECDGDVTPRLSHLPLVWMMKQAVIHGLTLDLNFLEASTIFSGGIQPNTDEHCTSSKASRNTLLADDEGSTSSTIVLTYSETKSKILALLDWATDSTSKLYRENALSPRGDALSFSISRKPNETFLEGLKGMGGRISQRLTTAGWWLLEIFPTIRIDTLPDPAGEDLPVKEVWSINCNFGQGRVLPPNPVLYHSVEIRAAASLTAFKGDGEGVPETSPYMPKATWSRAPTAPQQSLTSEQLVEYCHTCGDDSSIRCN